MPLLELNNLSCIRGQRQLFSALDFSLNEGEICQVLGPNGSGKTSLLRIVCGLAEPESGQVLWQGESIRKFPEAYHKDLLYIGHKAAVNSHLTALENLQAWADLQHLALSDKDLEQALIRVGLFGREDIPAMRLSAGQQRRIALARMVVSKAKLWVLDEPFTAIDIKGVSVMQQWFADHLATGGMILFTSHQTVDTELLNLKTLELKDA